MTCLCVCDKHELKKRIEQTDIDDDDDCTRHVIGIHWEFFFLLLSLLYLSNHHDKYTLDCMRMTLHTWRAIFSLFSLSCSPSMYDVNHLCVFVCFVQIMNMSTCVCILHVDCKYVKHATCYILTLSLAISIWCNQLYQLIQRDTTQLCVFLFVFCVIASCNIWRRWWAFAWNVNFIAHQKCDYLCVVCVCACVTWAQLPVPFDSSQTRVCENETYDDD